MAKAKPHAEDWEHNDEKFPAKRGVCDFCGSRDEIKLSFDNVRWICRNASACVLRWRKQRHGE